MLRTGHGRVEPQVLDPAKTNLLPNADLQEQRTPPSHPLRKFRELVDGILATLHGDFAAIKHQLGLRTRLKTGFEAHKGFECSIHRNQGSVAGSVREKFNGLLEKQTYLNGFVVPGYVYQSPLIGKHTRAIVPPSGRSESVTTQLLAREICRTIASPRPLPPVRLLRDGSRRRKG